MDSGGGTRQRSDGSRILRRVHAVDSGGGTCQRFDGSRILRRADCVSDQWVVVGAICPRVGLSPAAFVTKVLGAADRV